MHPIQEHLNQHIRQTPTDIKGETDSNTIIVGDFNTPLTPMDRSSKQKIDKETQVLKDTLDEMDLIVTFRTFQMHENTPSSQVHMGHSPGQTTSWVTNQTSVKFKNIEIISSIFSDHNTMRLDINYKRKRKKTL